MNKKKLRSHTDDVEKNQSLIDEKIGQTIRRLNQDTNTNVKGERKNQTNIFPIQKRQTRKMAANKTILPPLQTKFKDPAKKGRQDVFEQAWDDYKATKKIILFKLFITGLVFPQMTAKQGIKSIKEKWK